MEGRPVRRNSEPETESQTDNQAKIDGAPFTLSLLAVARLLHSMPSRTSKSHMIDELEFFTSAQVACLPSASSILLRVLSAVQTAHFTTDRFLGAYNN